MKYFIVAIVFFYSLSAAAQDYNVALIPDSLKENADVVKREEELNVTIESVNKVIIKHKYVVTILNENGARYAWYNNDYNSFIDLKDISGELYDQNGKKVRSVKKKDIADMVDDDGSTLITDDRRKVFNFFCSQYPYTVEFEDEQEKYGSYSLPEWVPVEGQKCSVEESKFSVQAPTGYTLRYKQFNYNGQSGTDAANNSFTWQVKNIKAITEEELQPGWEEVTPCVKLAPSDFSWGGYNGNLNTWQNFGKYINLLNAGRQELPDNVKQDVHQLTDNVKDTLEKIRILYKYLQDNTRYISIQLGIGGLQPLPATFVAQKKYGDCKALSNYMISLLKEAGLKANYVVVSPGEDNMYNGLREDFPANYFRHAISCVPLQKDTVWLECTSQTLSCGYLSSFTGNRQALLVNDDGGHVVNTPAYSMKDNQQLRNIHATIDAEGNLIADVTTLYTGFMQDDVHHRINTKSHDKIKDELKESFDLPTYDITDFHYDEHKDIIPTIEEKVSLSASNYASVSGKRLFVIPNILTHGYKRVTTTSSRKFDIVYHYSFRQADTINISLPSGYDVESMPKDIVINNKFGNYEIHFKAEGNTVTALRKYERSTSRFPPSDYADFVKFYDDIYKADRSKIVFVKKDG